MADDWLLLIALILPFAGSIVAAFLPTRARNAAAALAGAIALTGTAIMIMAYPALSSGAVIRKEIDWLPSLGLNLIVRLDGLSWLFAFLILRSEEHTSELQSLMRISYAVFCLKKKKYLSNLNS